MIQKDNYHYNFQDIDSYNKPFNFVISAREAGKSTAIWLKAYKAFLKGKTSVVFRRYIVDITDAYIDSIQEILKKFIKEDIKFIYSKGSMKDGVVDVYIGSSIKDKKPFIKILGLSSSMSRMKSLVSRNVSLFIFDEFICNTRMGEKYLNNEVFKFKEVFNTFQRESDGNLKCYFLGNPYSRWNPYFDDFKIKYEQLIIGNIVVGDAYAVEVYKLSEQLKEVIMKRNPLYKFDDSYSKYAFEGESVNDSQIRILEKQPDNYFLKHVFIVNNSYLGIFRNSDFLCSDKFWVSKVDKEYVSKNRNIYAFDFNNLVDGTQLLDNVDKINFNSFARAVRSREVQYKSISESYLVEQIYVFIK